MGGQRRVLAAGDRAHVDHGRDQFVGRPELGVLRHLSGTLDARLRQHLAETLYRRTRDRRVIQLRRDAALFESGVRDPVGLDVVGMSVETVLVVGHHHLGPVFPHQIGQPGRRLAHRCPPKRTGRVVLRPAIHARIVVPEQFEMGHPENLAARLELASAQRNDDLLVVARIVGLQPSGRVAQLAVGAGDQHGLHALIGVTSEHPPRADGFVVGMGVDGHQGKGLCGHAWQRRGRCRPAITSGVGPLRPPAPRVRPASPRADRGAAR